MVFGVFRRRGAAEKGASPADEAEGNPAIAAEEAGATTTTTTMENNKKRGMFTRAGDSNKNVWDEGAAPATAPGEETRQGASATAAAASRKAQHYLETRGGEKEERESSPSTLEGPAPPVAAATSRHSRSSSAHLRDNLSAENEDENLFVTYEKFTDDAVENMKLGRTDHIPDPKRPDHVVVKVKASTISLQDCLTRRGVYDSVSLPAVPGADLVGTIAVMGKQAAEEGRFQIGDAVAALVRVGGNQRYASVPVKDLVMAPGNLDSAQAACLVSTYMTAYQALHRCRPATKKNSKGSLEKARILIIGGNGPIGRAAIDLAKRAGAGMIFATAHESKHSLLRSVGAIPLPLNEEVWLPVVEDRMDLVIDGLCQDDYVSSRKALKKDGHLVATGMSFVLRHEEPGFFGLPSATVVWTATKASMMSNTTRFDLWKSSQEKPEEFKHDLEYLFALLRKGKIKPKIAERVPLDQVPLTHWKLEQGQMDGIPVCKPWKKLEEADE